MSNWVKALGIDYGAARIGVSVSDDIGLLAHPLETVSAADLEGAADRISEIVLEREIRDLVIGLPLRVSGEEGTAVDGVRRFIKILEGKVPERVVFHEVDERYTTVVAMEKLHQAGRTAKDSKGIIDQAAAIEILQQWLDSRADIPCEP